MEKKTRRPYIQKPEEQAGDVLRKAKLKGTVQRQRVPKGRGRTSKPDHKWNDKKYQVEK